MSKEVKVTLGATDNLSGVDKTYYKTDSMKDFQEYKSTFDVLLMEGSNGVSYYSVDKAGNIESVNTITLKADLINPITTHTVTPVPNSNGWYNSKTKNVQVNLAATDNLSGVAKTEYNDGSGWQTYTGPITLSAEKVHKIQYRSTDKAGNVEVAKTMEVKIDKTAPETTHKLTPAPNGQGWNNTDVVVELTATDNLSGVAKTEYNDGSGWQNIPALSFYQQKECMKFNIGVRIKPEM